jgi:hypothetical protein
MGSDGAADPKDYAALAAVYDRARPSNPPAFVDLLARYAEVCIREPRIRPRASEVGA